MHDQPNDNSSNMKLNNLHVNAGMNIMRQHGTLKFTPAHTYSVLVATWGVFNLSYATISHNDFNKTHILILYPLDIDTNHQTCLASTQQSKREKSDEIGQVEKASIAPIDLEAVSKIDPIVILR